MSLRVRKRHRLKKKEIKTLVKELQGTLKIEPFSIDDTVDLASTELFDIIFVNGEISTLIYDNQVFLTVKGLLKHHPQKRFVTVDMGAVSYVYNGADIMTPGIVDADKDIKEGDLVWIRDERNNQPLAVGQALLSGDDMVKMNKGKAVKSIHYVGDKLWQYGEN